MVFREVTGIQLDNPQAAKPMFREVGNIQLDAPQAAPQQQADKQPVSSTTSHDEFGAGLYQMIQSGRITQEQADALAGKVGVSQQAIKDDSLASDIVSGLVEILQRRI